MSNTGFGRCEKDFSEGPICYVNQPSTCRDITKSKHEPGQYYSWEACNEKHFTGEANQRKTIKRNSFIKSLIIFPFLRVNISNINIWVLFADSPALRHTDQLHPLKDDIISIQLDNSPCTCINFVNKNGVGNCKMGENRFDNKNVCYVALPSSCPDLKNSRTDAGKFLSAVACENNNIGTNDLQNSKTTSDHY